jgi:hypothetical protein
MMTRNWKPYFSVTCEHNGRVHRLPVNATYRELYDCARALDIKDDADEEDLIYGRYVSRLPESLTPTKDESRYAVELSDKRLGTLTPGQADAVIEVCRAFGLKFGGILPLIEYISEESEAQLYECDGE